MDHGDWWIESIFVPTAAVGIDSFTVTDINLTKPGHCVGHSCSPTAIVGVESPCCSITHGGGGVELMYGDFVDDVRLIKTNDGDGGVTFGAWIMLFMRR